MFCNMIKRLLGEKFRTYLARAGYGREDVRKIFFIFDSIELTRLFIDEFHCTGHKEETCNTKTGCFHPKHKKWNGSNNSNHNVCEHFWRKHNGFKFFKIKQSSSTVNEPNKSKASSTTKNSLKQQL